MCQKLVILVILFPFASFEDLCPDFITCESSEKSTSCPVGTFYRERVKLHSCCAGCVSLKGENSDCNFPADCKPGLTCSSKKKCEKDPFQACDYYKNFDPIWNKSKYWMPSCLPDGSYAPKQCKGEKMSGKCFCVDTMGKRIFGEAEWSKAENMTCICSRLVDKMKQTTKFVTYHCDSLGNFEPLQCDQKICWCANPKTGIPYTIMVPLEMMVSLPCYNQKEEGVQYYKECDSANHMKEVIKSLLWNHGTKEVTLSGHNCNFDGSYYRVQNIKEKKRCVYINNFPLTEATKSENVNCNCAFDRYVAQLLQVEFIRDCLPNGNYRKRQIWNDKEYCIDDDGFHYSNDPQDC